MKNVLILKPTQRTYFCRDGVTIRNLFVTQGILTSFLITAALLTILIDL